LRAWDAWFGRGGPCSGCGACLATCPPNALVAGPGGPRLLDDLCSGCGACLEVCPAGAVRLDQSGHPRFWLLGEPTKGRGL